MSHSTPFPTIDFVPNAEQIEQFKQDGFIIVPKFLSSDFVEKVKDRYEPLFRGDFPTGIYPDEWHWRQGLSLPNVTREICNAWKSDMTIASVVLTAELGKCAALLGGWEGARIGQDAIWMKPPEKGREINFHTDTSYVPWDEVTC